MSEEQQRMIVKFWGVRGSYTTVRPEALRYGGYTSCVSFELEGKLLVIDAGSGFRILGNTLKKDVKDIYIVLTHLHRDHVNGFPFFNPLYEKGRTFHLIDYENNGQKWSLLSLLDGINYPMQPDSIVADHYEVSGDSLSYLCEHGFQVSSLQMNHPGGALGYRVSYNGSSMVHMPDNELDAPNPVTSFDRFVEFCKGADVLSHDAMYVEEDLPEKRGWGHSMLPKVCELAVAAGVKHLVLFHHDPERDDKEIDQIQSRARFLLEPHGIECTAAYEGLKFVF
ncbi:MAG: MBL fold metallo-hydrolase [Rhodothermaceae bacterium]|nr:MBL fold metallo-hydrolase [Rhodothermaceae bacterium]